jgi:hypothetical protein
MMKKILSLVSILLLLACSEFESEADVLAKLKTINFGLPKDKAILKRLGPLIVSIPKEKQSKMPVLMVFGGLYYASPDFMLNQVPSIFFEETILVFAPCRAVGGGGYGFYKKQFEKMLRKEGVIIDNISVCGFSGGGPDALEASGEEVKVIGLIDAVPEIPSKKNIKAYVINAFNRLNWYDNEFYGEKNAYRKFDTFANWTRALGGFFEENSVKHELFPKYFFYKFRKRLVN